VTEWLTSGHKFLVTASKRNFMWNLVLNHKATAISNLFYRSLTEIIRLLYDGLWAGRPGLDFQQEQDIFPYATVSKQALGQTQPHQQWVPVALTRHKAAGVMKLTTPLNLVPMSLMAELYFNSSTRLRGVVLNCLIN
jgi:hypothetical protein